MPIRPLVGPPPPPVPLTVAQLFQLVALVHDYPSPDHNPYIDVLLQADLPTIFGSPLSARIFRHMIRYTFPELFEQVAA